MPKFIKRDKPTHEAIQVKWSGESAIIKSGDWIIRHPEGHTTICGDEWFRRYYQEIEEE